MIDEIKMDNSENEMKNLRNRIRILQFRELIEITS